MNAIVKYADCNCVTSYHWLGTDFSFEVDIVSANIFVTLSRRNTDDTKEKVIEFEIDLDLDDIHDYLMIISDGEEFTEKIYDEVSFMMETAIEEYLASGEVVLDLNVVSCEISTKITKLGVEFVERNIREKSSGKPAEK